MSTAAPAAPQKTTPNAEDLAPPEDAFWVRYSPHHEFPLSSISSVMLHILVIGLAFLFAYYVVFDKPAHKVPVEAVRLVGGGGGNKHGSGSGPGGERTAPNPVEAGPSDPTPSDPTPPTKFEIPDLKKAVGASVAKQFNDNAFRVLRESTTDMNKFRALTDTMAKIGPIHEPGKGGGGSGSGGGTGDGRGTGTGDGQGPGGGGNLTEREKEMIRWTMHFETADPADYLRQLDGMGAILAIPVDGEYKIVRDLKHRPAKLLDEDVAKIQRIYWVDEQQRSVDGIMRVLGINVRADRFVAFMPEDIENRLRKLENDHVGGRSKADIRRTHYKAERSGDRYVPVFDRIDWMR